MLQRLESGLQIALQRAGVDNTSLLPGYIHNLECSGGDGPKAEAWQHVRRLVNLIEAAEREVGIEHVSVRPATPLGRLYGLSHHELNQVLQNAVAEGDSFTADLARDILHVRATLENQCPACGGSGRWGDDIPCGRCGGR